MTVFAPELQEEQGSRSPAASGRVKTVKSHHCKNTIIIKLRETLIYVIRLEEFSSSELSPLSGLNKRCDSVEVN